MNNLLTLLPSICLEASCISFTLLPIAFSKKSQKVLVASLVCFIIIAVDSIFTFLPKIMGVSHFNWNFEGKLSEIFWLLFVIYILKWISPREVGLNIPKIKHILLAVAIVSIYTLFALTEWILTQQLPPKSILNIETLLFQFTLPGLVEELFFRGALLAIFNRYFVSRWCFLNVKWGVGAIIVTLYFIVGHLITFSTENNLFAFHLDYLSFDLIFLSLTLIYLREKTGSIWPGVLFHNLANGMPILVTWLLL